jgi:hypothetical protein
VPTTTKPTSSITHDDLVGLRSVLFHVNLLEHGGDHCGALQLSVAACNPSEAKVIDKFDGHIKPPAAAAWSNHACQVHGTCPNDARVASAVGVTEVWKKFVLFIERHLADGMKTGIIAAWGGQSLDCEWLFCITENTRHGALFVPGWCLCFMDPKKVVSHCGSCKQN